MAACLIPAIGGFLAAEALAVRYDMMAAARFWRTLTGATCAVGAAVFFAAILLWLMQ